MRPTGLLLLLLLSCRAAGAEPPRVVIPRIDSPPALADFVNGAGDDRLLKVTDFFQREPNDGAPASLATTAYLGYDAENLYIVFVCQDDPRQVRARLSKREDIFADDFVGVLLDTFHDRRRAYLFIANPLGIQLDGVTAEGQDDDYSFDTVWHSEGQVTGSGFVVRIAIPFKSLRFRSAPAQEWGIALARVIQRRNETSFWPHLTRRQAAMMSQLATVSGLEDISPGRNLQFIPYAFAAAARSLDEPASSYLRDNELRAGLDAKIVLRDALTLDLTLNPDFSQVESDEPQVTINQRFEVFFPEKRPFFIENADFFRSPDELFFSRRIADPEVGGRLTGKLGGWNLGALAIDDRAAGRLLPAGDPRADDRARILVGRVLRDVGQQSKIGALVTSRDFGGGYNRVFSLDARLNLTKLWVLEAQAMRSHSRGLDGQTLAGPAYYAELFRASRHLRFYSRYRDRSPDFRTELGFVPRVDMREVFQELGYNWWPKQGKILRFGPEVNGFALWDHQGELQEWQVEGEFSVELPGQTYLEVEREQTFERFEQIRFHRHQTTFRGGTQHLRWLALDADLGWGTGVNYFPAGNLPPFLADITQASVSAAIRPRPRWRIQQTYLVFRLVTRDDPALGLPAGRSVFNNHIFRTRLNYQFTRRLSLRAITDYNAVIPNSSLVALEPHKRLAGDVLLTYLVNYGTALHVGYTDTYENLALSPLGGFVRGGDPTRSTGRQFFVKLTYLFRF